MNYFQKYIQNFKGFSREIWILAIVTFINRAGTMVIPFLSKYLKEDLGFSYSQVGWIMACFGVGSFVGSWIGGKLTDKIGFYKIMVFSLFTSGILFLIIQYITSFEGLCLGIFIIMIIADMFRPAMFVSLGTYAKPENRTRALTLVRLAVNLGIAAGPAIGGLIIMSIGYSGLFWVDGISCMFAISIFAILVKEIKPESKKIKEKYTEKISIWKDLPFVFFLTNSFLMAMVFFQLYTTLPLYHHEKYQLTEFQTGLLMTLNGLLIFLFEMPLVSYFEQKKTNHLKIILIGSFLMSLSFLVLLFDAWVGILVVSIFFLAFGIMFVFPFSNAFALSRAPKGKEGMYMGYYAMSFSVAHIASSKLGMEIINLKGFLTNWTVMFIFGIIGTCFILLVIKKIRQENSSKAVGLK